MLDSGDVTVNNSASVSVDDESICAGESATLTAIPTTLGGTFSWTPGNQTTDEITVSPNNTANYTVTYTFNGCVSTSSAQVTVNPIPSVSISPNTTTICEGNSATLQANPSIPNGTYDWLTPSANNETTQNLSVAPTTNTSYTV